jgi:intracellular multiplication protein IcmK
MKNMAATFKTGFGCFILSMVMSVFTFTFAESAAGPNAKQDLPLSPFQQWLKDNGYLQPNSHQPPRNPMKPLTYEENKQAMLNAIPSKPVTPAPERMEAFNAMLQQNMPMTPEQVVELHQQIDLAQRVAAIPATIPPKPVTSTIMVNLAPGTTPPAVRLAQGYVSSLVFIDSTGAPWPIAAFDIGNPKAVNMQWDGKSNILFIQANSPYSNGDIVIRLVGLPTPITLELVSGQRVVDYRADIHVSGIGPNTKELPLGTTLPASANQLLLGVLDGIAPAGGKPLDVMGATASAWLLGDVLYLRTRFTVLSPGWMGKMVSPDGMIAYELPKTSSVLVSRFGEPVELKIEGF